MHKTLINGYIFEHKEALIHVEERGFRFGDGVFETIRIQGGLPYLWRHHTERLQAGLKSLHIAYDTQALLTMAMAVLRENAVQEGMLRLSISRGIGSRGYLPTHCTPTLVMETLPPVETPVIPVALWLSRYEKISPSALPTDCKLAQGLNSTLARMEALENGCFEALQRSAKGYIAEAASANLFWRKGNVLYTPSLSTGALAGVTRRRICELSPFKVEEGEYDLDVLRGAESVVLTNSACGIAAVGSLQPEGIRWDSTALADTLNRLRDHDITRDTLALRELLA